MTYRKVCVRHFADAGHMLKDIKSFRFWASVCCAGAP